MRKFFKHKKIIVLLVLVAVFTTLIINRNHLSFLTSVSKDTYDYNLVEDGEEKIKIDNENYAEGVTFDAYFLKDIDNDGNADGVRNTELVYGKSDKLYFDLNVSGDYSLKNGKIRFNNSNVILSGTLAKSSAIPKTLSSTNYSSIDLSQIEAGTSSFFYLNVSPNITSDLKKFNATNEVVFTGTIVNINTGEEVEVSKTISYDVDSYSNNITTRIGATTSSNPDNVATITYSIEVMETANAMPLKASYLTGSVSDFEGRHPSNVTVRSADGYSVDYDYDSSTQTFTAVKNATVSEDKVITRQAYNYINNGVRYNKWYITVEYPTEEGDSLENKSANISLEAWDVGFTNSDLEEKKSNVVQRILSHTFTVLPIANLSFKDSSSIGIGSYIDTLSSYYVRKDFLNNVYLGQETGNFEFEETWNFNSITDKKAQLLYTELGDRFKSDAFLKEYTTYKSMTVYNVPNIPDYKIYIYNADNDELIHIITKENVAETFNFPENVRLIKILTSEVEENKNFTMRLIFTKEINSDDMMSKVLLQDFLTYGSLANSGHVTEQNNGTNVSGSLPYNGNASFSNSYSSATLTSKKTSFAREVSETSIPMSLTVDLNAVDAANNVWYEGYFLVKLPKEIIDVENLSISPNRYIVSNEIVDINGQKFIKIILNNDDYYNTDFTLSFNAVVNPKTTECSGYVELYAINNMSTLYYNSVNDSYDINGNGITTEKASYSRLHINITAPKELLTGAIITDYDSLDSQTVSPLIADVNPKRETTDARINLFLINNSTFKIKNIEIVGKVAYTGNQYEGIEGALGSEYNTTMAGPIEIPDKLSGKVTVYYSTEENPTRDISDTNNGWVTEVSDYSTIKSYMIKIDDSVEMSTNDKYDFYYPVDIPNDTTNLLKKTYYNHGVYFKRVTDAGLKDAKVTAPKLGIRTARKYDLDLDVFKSFTDMKMPGGQYILTDDEGTSKTITIDSNGHALVKDLYVNKEYTLVQYSAYNRHIKDEEEKTFKITNGENDELVLTKDGTFRRIEFENDVLSVDFENEMLYTLDLHNIDIESNVDIKNSKFKVTGKNHENGTVIYTDNNGHANLYNMVLSEEYVIEQTRVDNYAPVAKFRTKIERDPNTHEIKVLVEDVPYFEKATCDNRVSAEYGSNGNGLYYIKTDTAKTTTSNRVYQCYIEIDLTKFREIYNVHGSLSTYDYFYGTNYEPDLRFTIVKNEMRANAPSLVRIHNTSDYSGYGSKVELVDVTKAYEYNSDTSTFTQVDLKGGSKYYIHFYYNRGYVGSTRVYGQLYETRLRAVNNRPELIFVDERVNVHPKEYNTPSVTIDGVSQTVKNYSLDSTSNPILEIEVKNKYIEKAYLEINKIDGETNEPLKGAQFKISGPGLPDGGKYVTVDDEGKVTVEAYLSYSGNLSHIPGMTSAYPKVNWYTVEEVIPPKGYSKDSKTYTFELTRNVTYNSNTGENTFNYITEYDLYNLTGNSNGNNRFANLEIDENTKTWRATIKDYPIVKVNKIDAETGVVLPNTYYAVYAVNRVNGTEILDFAKDADGNYVGEKLRIDGKDYYVVKTDENGSFTLNLSGGSYQLKEIQAADNKYEIDDQIIYFGIGDSIPYQAAGLTLTGAYGLTNDSYIEKASEVYPTEDGGYIVTSVRGGYSGPMVVKKLDKNGNEVWNKELKVGYHYDYYYEYFDDPNRITKYSWADYNSGGSYSVTYKEDEDAYYFVGYALDMYKLDKESGDVLFHTSEDNPGKYVYTFNSYCDIPEGKTTADYYDYLVNPNYTDKVYCYDYTYVYYNYFGENGWAPHSSFGSDGYLYAIYQLNGNGHYGFELKDGTRISPEPYTYTDLNGNVNTVNQEYLLKFDNDGALVSAIPLGDKMYEAKANYINTEYPDFADALERYKTVAGYYEIGNYQISKKAPDTNYINGFKVLDNGDMVYLNSGPLLEYQYKPSSSQSYYTVNTISMPFVMRLDKNGNIKSYRFLAINGRTQSIYNTSSYEDPTYIITDDGSVEYMNYSTETVGTDVTYNNDNIGSYLINKPYYKFDIPKEEGHPDGYSAIYKYRWDSNGNPQTPIEILRGTRDTSKESTTNDMKRLYGYYYYFTIAPFEDGYIVSTVMTGTGNLYTNTEPNRMVELKSGEIITIDKKSSYVVYKVNADSSIEWIKQYGNIFSNRYGINNIKIIDNKFYDIRTNAGSSWAHLNIDAEEGQMITSLNDPEHADLNNSESLMLLEFELKDEVKAEAAEAYNLTLENRRKEYKVTVESNAGGTFDVKDENNTIIYTGTEPGTIETIKYGDDSKNKLIIKPDSDYGVKSVTVNGEKASYTVNNDGTLVLNKFTNVQENININVQFELGSSRVVVHHYLKGTTTKISDDELLQGKINDPYETEAKADTLYSLVKNSNDEYVLPSNYKGKFTSEPIEVTYYYDTNMVDLVVYFYRNDTTESLAPTVYSKVKAGQRYLTEAANIPSYRVVNILGDEEGIINRDVTEVTYFYDAPTSNPSEQGQGIVTVHHIATDTCRDLVEPTVRILDYNTAYETEQLTNIPEGYRYKSRTDNYFGVINEENNSVDVYYYYDRIKSRITVKYIDSDTNKSIEDNMNIYVNLGQNYVTKELINVPKGYVLKSKPVNASGIANEERIEVVYKYVKDGSNSAGSGNNNSNKGVKGASEKNPNTGDFIGKYFIIGIISIVGIVAALLIVKKNKKK